MHQIDNAECQTLAKATRWMIHSEVFRTKSLYLHQCHCQRITDGKCHCRAGSWCKIERTRLLIHRSIKQNISSLCQRRLKISYNGDDWNPAALEIRQHCD